MKAKVKFLKHSGVMVETSNYQLFFDVISEVADVINPIKKQIFFVSHGHQDHFDHRIAQHKKGNVTYIISDDIELNKISDFGNHLTMVKPNETYTFDGLDHLFIRTFESTDLGVAFYVRIEECHVFHSGDLNWWHWEKMPKEARLEEEVAFKKIMDDVFVEDIEIAFIPLDPRIGNAATWAVEYFTQNKPSAQVVPIHFGDQYNLISELASTIKVKSRLLLPKKENEYI